MNKLEGIFKEKESSQKKTQSHFCIEFNHANL